MMPFISSQPVLPTDPALTCRVLNPDRAAGAQRLLHGVGNNGLGLLQVGQQLADADTLGLLVRALLALGPASFAFYQVDFSTGESAHNRAQQLHAGHLYFNRIAVRLLRPAGAQ